MHNIKVLSMFHRFSLVSGLKAPCVWELGEGVVWLMAFSWMAGQWWLAGEAVKLTVAAYLVTPFLVCGGSVYAPNWPEELWIVVLEACFESKGLFKFKLIVTSSHPDFLPDNCHCFSHPYCWMWSERELGQESLSCSVISSSKLTELKTAEMPELLGILGKC